MAYRLKRDARAGRALDRLLKNLSGDQTVSVIRAFSYFSHLANIAEDRHHLRAGASTTTGSPPAGGVARDDVRAACARRPARRRHRARARPALISPVLTAHPTEVQRKSILDAERAIAQLGSTSATPPRPSTNASRLRAARCARHVTQLWQTRMLRQSRLTVDDEVENALSYYHATFLRRDPAPYREVEDALSGRAVAPFFPHGSWIGGDRDGNPNVDAGTRCAGRWRASPRRCCAST